MDCLPEASEWSAQSQYAMLLDHLQTLESAPDALALITEMPHLEELNARCLEAHSLLKALARQPRATLKSLSRSAC